MNNKQAIFRYIKTLDAEKSVELLLVSIDIFKKLRLDTSADELVDFRGLRIKSNFQKTISGFKK